MEANLSAAIRSGGGRKSSGGQLLAPLDFPMAINFPFSLARASPARCPDHNHNHNHESEQGPARAAASRRESLSFFSSDTLVRMIGIVGGDQQVAPSGKFVLRSGPR